MTNFRTRHNSLANAPRSASLGGCNTNPTHVKQRELHGNFILKKYRTLRSTHALEILFEKIFSTTLRTVRSIHVRCVLN